jgi:PHD/YefM family antitoxin component YafN of YafNO toxin-antitoxin module
MAICLNEQQQQALDSSAGTPAKVVDPRTNTTYVLVPAADYETVHEVLEDEKRQRAIRAMALRNAAGRMDEIP